jgi:hypothetical protein
MIRDPNADWKDHWSRLSFAQWNGHGLLNSKYNDLRDLNAEWNEEEGLNTEQNYHRVLNNLDQDLNIELYELGDFNAVRYDHGYLEPTIKNSTQSKSIMEKLNYIMNFFTTEA